jgi:GT2 family glycosyltransferase
MARINRRTVIDLDVEWPSISIVVCAHNAAGTIDECLSHCLELDYPDLEVIVVDDGSTDTTPDIVATHLDVRLITISRSGLSVARNVGYQSARGELIAYLDADAYPAPQWPWYLALAAIGPGVGGSGGPNIPPSQEPASARVVARSPGGPVPQLVSADRAEHIPGCNMAFWRHVLEGLDGFDPVLEAAEDLEFEWRVRDGGCDIAYHPAALVWHHRRPGLGAYLRQQRHYGRGQAILERRHPERFVPGHRVRRAAARLRPRRTRTGGPTSYPVKYLTLPRHQGAATELAHQWGVPQTLVVCATAPLGLIRPKLAAPALVATICVGALLVIDIVAAGKDCARFERRLGIRASIAVFSLLRPLAFRWGHLREWSRLHVAGSDWPARPAASNPADCRALDR